MSQFNIGTKAPVNNNKSSKEKNIKYTQQQLTQQALVSHLQDAPTGFQTVSMTGAKKERESLNATVQLQGSNGLIQQFVNAGTASSKS